MNSGLYRLKAWFTGVLTPLIDYAVRRRISPDAFTVLGVLGGAFAGFGLATVHTWWVFVGVVIRLAVPTWMAPSPAPPNARAVMAFG